MIERRWISSIGHGQVVVSEAALDRLEQRLARAEEDSEFLGFLEAAGVDNWEGYGEARQMQREASA